MNNKIIIITAIIILSLIVGAFSCTKSTPAQPATLAPSTPKVIKWNMQTSYPPASDFTILYGEAWIKWVKQITDGRLQIELHPAGTFAASGEVLSALGKGTMDAALEYAGFYPAKVPLSDVETGLPLAWKDGSEAFDAFYNRGLFKLVEAEYAKHNVKILGIGYDVCTKYNLAMASTINSLGDIKGKKIRASGIYAKWVTGLGGLPTVVAPTEIYMALKTGIIDGAITGIATLDSYKINEICKSFVIEPTLTPLVTSFPWVNMDSWNKLPVDIQKLLVENTRYFNAEAGYQYRTKAFATITSSEQKGVKWMTLSAEDEQKARVLAIGLWDEVAKKSPEIAKAVEIVKQQMKDYGRMK